MKLFGLEALGYALLKNIQVVTWTENGTSQNMDIQDARERSYQFPFDAQNITLEAELHPTGWRSKYIKTLVETPAMTRAQRAKEQNGLRSASKEEFTAAAFFAEQEQHLFDAETLKIKAAGYAKSKTDGFWYKVDSKDRAIRDKKDKVIVYSRARVLELIAK